MYFMGQVRIDINRDTLMKIASITDGKCFRATDTESLKEIYRQMGYEMEKTQVEKRRGIPNITSYSRYY